MIIITYNLYTFKVSNIGQIIGQSGVKVHLSGNDVLKETLTVLKETLTVENGM